MKLLRRILLATSLLMTLPAWARAADLIVSSPITIGTPETYDNVTVTGTGVLTISAPLTVTANMTIQSGGWVTHAVRDTAGLVLNVTGTLDVQSGGLIELNGRGLLGGSGGNSPGETFDANDNIVVGAGSGGTWAAGASHGGNGNNGRQGTAPVPYGLLENPRHLGGGGGGGVAAPRPNGGGRLRVTALTMVLNGTVRANGIAGAAPNGVSGGGAGGSIRLDVGTLTGSGSIEAKGGAGAHDYSGAGGGGRIAIYYDTMTLPEANIAASGGAGLSPASAGTLYLKDNAQANGDLIVDNGGTASGLTTRLMSTQTSLRRVVLSNRGWLGLVSGDVASLTVEQPIALTSNGTLALSGGVAVTVSAGTGYEVNVQGGGALTVASGATLGVTGGDLEVNVQGAGTLTVASGATWVPKRLRVDGTSTVVTSNVGLAFPVASDLEVSGSGTLAMRGSAVLAVASLDGTNVSGGIVDIGTGCQLDVGANTATVASGVTLVKDGLFGANDQIGSLTVLSGGWVTHAVRDTAGLVLNVTGTLDVQSGGLIELNGRGLLGGSGGNSPGETFDANDNIVVGAGSGGTWAAGASHGGNGNNGRQGTAPVPYGLLENPRHLGGGGGGGVAAPRPNGGGRLRVTALTMVLNGTVRANGIAGAAPNGVSGGGAGGSIRLDVGTLTGSGSIEAKGGAGAHDYSGAGGGGRIAIYYDTMTLPEANIAASGGAGLSPASAGTLYLKDNAQANGDLIVDNGGTASGLTTRLMSTQTSLRRVVLSNRGWLGLVSGDVASLTVEQPIALTSNGTLALSGGVAVTVSAGTGYEVNVQGGGALTVASGATLGVTGGDLEVNVQGAGTLTVASGATWVPKRLRVDGTSTVVTSNVGLAFPVASDLEVSGSGTLAMRGSAVLAVASLDGTNVSGGIVDIGTGCQLDVGANTATVASGVTLVKDGLFGANDQIGSLTVLSGGWVTHAVRDTAGLVLNVTGTLDVQSGGLIELNGRGLLGGSGGNSPGETFDANDNIVVGAGSGGTWAAGASHGGNGNNGRQGTAPVPYGLLENPRHLGGGGGGGVAAPRPNGGGRLRVTALTMVLNGTVRANGIAGAAPNGVSGGGAGGSIRLDVGTLTGSGSIEAKGGAGAHDYSGAGGGGRIAIYYDTMTLPEANIAASGGAGLSPASAGTLYLKDNAQANGDLIVDNRSVVSGLNTPLLTNLLSFRDIGVRGSAGLSLDAGRRAVDWAQSITLAAGTLSAADTIRLQGAALRGAGTVATRLVNNGLVSPGASPGQLVLSGGYEQGPDGTLRAEMQSATVGGYDHLHVVGEARLAGTLEYEYLNAYTPPQGTRFPVVSFGSRQGTFANLVRTGTAHVTSVSYVDTTISLVADDLAADVTPPVASFVTGPAENGQTSATSASFTWTGTDNASPPSALQFRYRADGGPWSSFGYGTSAMVSGLGEGPHSFEVMAVDEAANPQTTPTMRSWTVDLTGAETAITSGPLEGSTITTANTIFGYTGTDNFATSGQIQFAWRMSGGAFSAFSSATSATPSGLVDGVRTFEVKARDAAGNEDATPASRSFTVHAQAPTVAFLTGPAEGSSTPSASAAFTWTLGSLSPVANRAATTYAYRLDGGAFSAEAPDTFVSLGSLGEGTHALVVRATDDASLQGEATRTWIVDLTSPTTTIASGPAEGGWSGTSVTFGLTGTDNLATVGQLTYRASLDAGPFDAAQASPRGFTGLAEGAHTAAFVAVDPAGNEDATAATRTWTVDATAPAVAIDSGPAEGATITTGAPAFGVSGSDNLSLVGQLEFSHAVDGGAFTAYTSATTRSLSGLGEGGHTFGVKARDLAGNESAVVTRNFVVHVTAPEKFIVEGPPAYGTQTGATFTFSANSNQAPETIEYAWRLDGGAYTAWGPATPASYSGLGEGNHVFDLKARDGYGLEEELSTPFAVDVTGPGALITGGPAAGGWSNTAAPTFTVTGADNLAPVNLLQYAHELDGGGYGGYAAGTTIPLAGLSAGPHTLCVKARDAAGNEGVAVCRTWTVDLTAPETAVLTGPEDPVVVEGNSVTFTYGGSDEATAAGQLKYATALDGGAFGAATAATTATVSGLTDGPHTFRARAVDLAGNVDGTPASRAFTSDALPPVVTITGGPGAGSCQAGTSATVTWTASDVVTPAGALEHAWSLDGGAFTGYGAVASAELSGLSEGVHTVTLRARDALGHVGSAARSFRVDLTMPVAYLPTTLMLDGNTFRVTCTGTDAGGIVTYRVQISADPNFGTVAHEQVIGAGGTLDYTGAYGSTYYARAQATDCAGNEGGYSGASNGATIADLPDLSVTQVTASPTATSGQTLGVTFTVGNVALGGTNVPSWYDDVYLSPTSTFNVGTATLLVRVTNLTFLAQNETYTVVRNVTLPLGLEGTYYVHVVTDNGGQVPESNGGNNVGVSSAVEVALGNYGDLQVTQVVAPPTALSSEVVTVSWTVTNGGSGRTNVDNWWDTILFSADADFDYTLLGGGQLRVLDLPVGRVHRVGGLDPGEQYTASAQVTVPSNASGTRYFLVVSDLAADAQNQTVAERGNVFEHVSEVNAGAAEPTAVTLQAPPDLVAESASIGTPNAVSGGSFTVSWTVRNGGFNPTPNTSWADRVYLSADGTLDGGDLVMGTFSRSGSLALSATYTQTRTMGLANGFAGSYQVFVVTDVHGAVGEYLENNNAVQTAGTLSVALSPWANLRPEGGTTPDTVRAGDQAVVTWVVKNRGVATTYGGWTDEVWISPSPTSTAGGFVATSVAAGGSYANGQGYGASATVQIPVSLGGTYYAHVVTDRSNALYEHSDEGDNFGTLGSFHVVPYPPVDVAVTAASVGVSSTQTGGGLPVTWTLKNLGTGATRNGSWNEEIWLSSDSTFSGGDIFLANSYHGGGIGPGGSYTRTFTPGIPYGIAGTYYVIVRTLPGGGDDANGGNNVKAAATPVAITLIPPPDLTVSGVTVPGSATAGQEVTLGFTVSNVGSGDVTNRTWFSQAYLSRDPYLDGSDVSLGVFQGPATLAAGGTSVPAPVVALPNWASGGYYVVVRSDSRNDLFEGGAESNNTAYSPPLVVALPPSADLAIQNVVVPATATPGEPVTISYDIVNQGGNAAVGSLQNGVYMSADGTFVSEEDPLVGIEVRSINLPPGGVAHLELRARLDRPITVNAAGGVTGTLPPLTPGPYYAIVRANIRASVRESDLANNGAASALTLTADVAALTLEVPLEVPVELGQERYYRVTVPSGFDLRISTASDVEDATLELLAAYGRTPSPSDFDYAGPTEFTAHPEVLVPTTQAGTYYVRLRPLSLGSVATVKQVTLLAQLLPFSVFAHTPAVGGAPGRVTVTVQGAGLRDTTVVSLERAATPGVAVATASLARYVNSTRLQVRFDLTGVAEETYDLVVANGAERIVVAGGFRVEAARPLAVAIDIDHADVLRRTATGTFVVHFTNPSNQDVPVLTARVLAPGASVLKSLVTTADLRSASERLPAQLMPLTDDAVVLRDCAAGDSLLAVDLVGANLAPGETRTATLGLAGFSTSPYSMRALAQASTLADYLDRQVALYESARQSLLADPSGVPAPLVLLAGDPVGFRDSALIVNEVGPGIVSLAELESYLLDLGATPPAALVPGPEGPPALLAEVVAGCVPAAAVPECVPDVGVVGSALPGCVSVFCAAVPVRLGLGGADGVQQDVTLTTVQGYSTTLSADARVVVPCDPNAITGPAGYGDQHWVNAADAMNYRVDFENLPAVAQAPAQVVRVAVPLDPDLDLTSFRLGSFGFGGPGGHTINVPINKTSYSTEQYWSDLGLRVRVTCGIDLMTGEASWTFTSIDPLTGLQPTDPTKGFLPVNDPTGRGQGFVNFTIRPKANVALGTGVSAQATIRFDANAPLPTSVASNAVDASPPTSSVLANPQVIDSTRVRLAWQGGDAEGAGLAAVSLYMRRDSDPVQLVAEGLTGTELEVPVQPGHLYAFRSQATDHAGNFEPPKTGFDVEVPVGTPLVGVEPPAAPATPAVTMLHGAAPNPSVGNATVRFDLAQAGPVTLELYDLQGRRLQRILEGRWLEAGRHALPLVRPASGPGLYFLRLHAAGLVQVRRVVMLK